MSRDTALERFVEATVEREVTAEVREDVPADRFVEMMVELETEADVDEDSPVESRVETVSRPQVPWYSC